MLTKILEAAMEAVTSGGFASLSMNKLADAVDFTPGALYRYFDSKDALLSALVNLALEDLGERVTSAVAQAGEDPFVRIFALTHAYRAFSVEQPHKFGLLAMSLAEPRVLLGTPASAEPVVRSITAALAPLGEALGAAAAKGKLEPGELIERTLVLWSAIQGALQLQKSTRVAPQLIDVERLSVQAARTLLRGWGAKPRALDAAYEKVIALGLAPRTGGPS